jgi:hypothetical protein
MSYLITPKTQQKADGKNKPKKQQNLIKTVKSSKTNEQSNLYQKIFAQKNSLPDEKRDNHNDEVNIHHLQNQKSVRIGAEVDRAGLLPKRVQVHYHKTVILQGL